jgi:integrase
MSYVKNTLRTVRTLSVLEQKKALETIGEHRDGFRDYVLISLALGTGLRETEIAALDVGDVADQVKPRGPGKGGAGGAGLEVRRRVELRTFAHKGPAPKRGKRPRTQRVFLSRIVRKKLAKFLVWKRREGESLEPTAPLFCAGISTHGEGLVGVNGKRSARIADRTIRHMWRTWQTRAGFKAPLFTFHELRHTFGTTLANRTKDPRYVQRALRHANLETTKIYMEVTDDDLARAIEEQPA